MKMFDWFRRKSCESKSERIEDSCPTGKQHVAGWEFEEMVYAGHEGQLTEIVAGGLLAIGTFGLLHPLPTADNHFADHANPAVTVTVNANNVNIHDHDGMATTYIVGSVKPREDLFSVNKPRPTPRAAKKKLVEEKSGCNPDKVRVHPVSVDVASEEGRGRKGRRKGKSWRSRCLSCFKADMGPELNPPNTNFARKPYTDERWIKTDAEYVVLEF